MMSALPTPLADAELSLIQQDASDLVRVLLGPREDKQSGLVAFSTLPLVGLFAEESFRYFSRPSSPVYVPTTPLFVDFPSAVTKTRARIKLFDDTDGYADGLVEALAVAHTKSVDRFCEPHRGNFFRWIKRLQPDLGIFFAGESLIATTHTVLPAVGLTLHELRALTPAELKKLGQRMLRFGTDVGRYLSEVAAALAPLGKPVELRPDPLALDAVALSYNDFSGAKFYRRTCERLRPTEERLAGTVKWTPSFGPRGSTVKVGACLFFSRAIYKQNQS